MASYSRLVRDSTGFKVRRRAIDEDLPLSPRDRNGHGKRRRKLVPTKQRPMILVAGSHHTYSGLHGHDYLGEVYHTSRRNFGRKPKHKDHRS